MNTLKMVFKLSNEKTVTYSLADPKADLTGAEAAAVAQDIVDNGVIRVGTATPTAIKDIYINKSERQNLA